MAEFSSEHHQISPSPARRMHRHPHRWVLKSGGSRAVTGLSAQELFFPADQAFDTLEQAKEYALPLTASRKWRNHSNVAGEHKYRLARHRRGRPIAEFISP
jgi:hypothetical protein